MQQGCCLHSTSLKCAGLSGNGSFLITEIGSCWGISGGRVEDPGRKLQWDCFPRSPNTKKGWSGGGVTEGVVFSLKNKPTHVRKRKAVIL